ncbi:hypothetical protein SAMN00790413_03344 [Deinococcus hopiensis KR-140]|uniref:Uncharacterized protein n=1 Tax=Deinococcus hopiensis KR-140 TaxID=695939 RepID=A0A1W1UW10_9DEIO|nr:hypothetical protein SAMN00790413_03344 [Deinococcus hopiensis KR-140]
MTDQRDEQEAAMENSAVQDGKAGRAGEVQATDESGAWGCCHRSVEQRGTRT